jgi:hypothetical protein
MIMSHIPLPRNTSIAIPKPSTIRLAQSPNKSNIPGGPGLTRGMKTPTISPKRVILLNDSTIQSPRSVPESLSRRPRIYGSSTQASELWKYVRSVGQKLFIPAFYDVLFPNSLLVMKRATIMGYDRMKSKIPAPRASSITPDFKAERDPEGLDLSVAFNGLRHFTKDQKRDRIRSVADFCLLYAGVVVLFCSADSNRTNQECALFFLKQFLQLDLGPRPHESSILFAILIRQGAAPPTIRAATIAVLAQLADLDADVYARLATGGQHHDRDLSGLCREAFEKTTRDPDELAPATRRAFTDIPSDAQQTTALRYMEGYLLAFDEPQSPGDPIGFVRNVLRAVRRYIGDAAVLLNGAECLRLGFRCCRPCPVELSAEIIEFCFDVLSGELFYDGMGSFEAVEAVQNLSNDLFGELRPNILLPAVAAAIANSKSDNHLPPLLNKLKEYLNTVAGAVPQRSLLDVAAALETFHPNFVAWPDFLPRSDGDTMTRSIERLMNPDTIFEETDAIVAGGDSRVIAGYPTYLRGFLQRAFFLYKQMEPIGMTEMQRGLAGAMITMYESMMIDDMMPGGRFCTDRLRVELEEIRQHRLVSMEHD